MKTPLSGRVGRRIRSRLCEMCRTVEIFAPTTAKKSAPPPTTASNRALFVRNGGSMRSASTRREQLRGSMIECANSIKYE
jgi:hypothetical protein